MWYFTVSSSNPKLVGPNGISLGSYLSTWLLTLLWSSKPPFFSSSSFLLFQSTILEHMEFNWHFNPDDKCLYKHMGRQREMWGLVEGNQKGTKVSHFCFLLTQLSLGMFLFGTRWLWHFGSYGRPSLTSKRGLHGWGRNSFLSTETVVNLCLLRSSCPQPILYTQRKAWKAQSTLQRPEESSGSGLLLKPMFSLEHISCLLVSMFLCLLISNLEKPVFSLEHTFLSYSSFTSF